MNLVKIAAVCAMLMVSCVNVEISDVAENPSNNPTFKFASSSPVIINEICTNNAGIITDESKDDPDWIELYNQSDSTVSLNGYGLTDDPTQLYKWTFANVSIKPHEYMVVFASGKDIKKIDSLAPADTVRFVLADAWTDMAQGGKSTVKPYEYANLLTTDSLGKKVISAEINLIDNRPTFDWSAAKVTVMFNRQYREKGYDFSDYNTIEFTMTLEKNKELVVRLLQGSDVYDWLAPSLTIKGTGNRDDKYSFPLVNGVDGVNLKFLTGISIEAPQYHFMSTKFTLSRMHFYHTGRTYHTNFKLSGSDRLLVLSKPDSLTLDTVRIAEMPQNLSLGKCKGGWQLMNKPTPGLKNDTSYYVSISKVPECVTKGGFYNSPVNVVLKSVDASEIFYTLDGSIPTTKSKRYGEPFTIDSTTVLRYAGFRQGTLNSNVVTETFFINVTTQLPVVSIAAEPGAYFDPDTGMYVGGPDMSPKYPYFMGNFWKDIEVPSTIQLYEIDKKLRFTENAGTSIMGNWSRAEPKKSIGVKFNERYGNSFLEYPLFPKYPELKKFKKFVLRNNGGNFGNGYFNDPLMQSLIDGRGVDYQKYRPVVVFINGKYFGIHQLMEAANEDYCFTNYNLDKTQVDFYDVGSLVQGSAAKWNQVKDYLLSQVKTFGKGKDSLSDSAYANVKDMVDVNNYIDYMALEMFINNMDWPANNMRWWRNNTNGKWRWLVYDTDCGFGSWAPNAALNSASNDMFKYVFADTIGTTDYPNGGKWVFLLSSLMQNKKFKEDFANRYATLLATNFSSQNILKKIDSMNAEVESEISRDSLRWNMAKYGGRQRWLDSLKSFATLRPQYVLEHIKKYFNASGTFKLSINSENGIVTINDMKIPDKFTGTYFTGITLTINAVSSKGRLFKKWSDGNTENPRRINSDKDLSLQAIFE